MSIHSHKRRTLIGRVCLLGASAGVVGGLLEAYTLLIPHWPLPLAKPLVHPSYWFFAPLLDSIVLGTLGLLAGALVALSPSRYLRVFTIAALMGLIGCYYDFILESYAAGATWLVFLREILTPGFAAALAFGCTVAVLWPTWRPSHPLGVVSKIPLRKWALVVVAPMIIMSMAVGISILPEPLAVRATSNAKSRLPNFVLIVFDTARADHLSAYGYSRQTTPNVDALAKRGVLFENAISASSWTLPAMASMLTNLLPHQHGASADFPLGNGPKTLAEVMRMAGYETAGFNANTTYGAVPWGLSRGFETYDDGTSSLGYSFNATLVGHQWLEPLSEKWFNTSYFTRFDARQVNEQVYHWYERRSGRPYFLFLNYIDAHDPYEVPPPYDHRFGQVSEEAKLLLPEVKQGRARLSGPQRESLIAGYDDALAYIDSQVGELLRLLDDSPEGSNTYVILTSDHGEAFGEHQTYTHGWNLYREVLHVPLIIVGPGLPAGVRIADIASTRRIFPTVLDLAGAKAPVLHQSGLRRFWSPDYVPRNPEEATLSEMVDASPPPTPRGMISIMTREWHFIYRLNSQDSRLYRWVSDPLEQQDVSEVPENQAVIERLKGRIVSMVERSYRPWRDPRYLQPLQETDLSPRLETLRPGPPAAGKPLGLLGAGAAQALFSPNPETPAKISDDDMVRSIPYGEP